MPPKKKPEIQMIRMMPGADHFKPAGGRYTFKLTAEGVEVYDTGHITDLWPWCMVKQVHYGAPPKTPAKAAAETDAPDQAPPE